MIIRFTVHDNDFHEFMSLYLRNFSNRLSCCDFDTDISSLSREEILEKISIHRRLNTLLNPNVDVKLTSDDKKFIIGVILNDFNRYVDYYNFEYDHAMTASYLKENFKVNILDSIEDKWENGEAYYWFQHSNSVICQ